jgi:anti-sigma regulatory factor (Ser/Thr protein kinase)
VRDAAYFSCDPASASRARRFVRGALLSGGYEAAADVGSLLAGELVTNAILHARTAFEVTVEAATERIRVSVRDRSPLRVQARQRSIDSGTGRGLLLVQRMSTEWGVDQGPDGKSVWFEIPPTGDVEAAAPDLDDFLAMEGNG